MNLEFICCILYGLKDVFQQKQQKLTTKTLYRSSLSLSNDRVSIGRQSLKADYSQELKDRFMKQKKIFDFNYQKLFAEEDIDLEATSTNKNKENKDQNDKDLQVELTKKQVQDTSIIDFSITLEESMINNNSDNKSYDAKITEYCPTLFHDLRKEECLEYRDLVLSLDPIMNKDQMLQIKESAGKSGSFFFFSYDKKFIIKTVKDHELKTMLGSFMEKYYLHIIQNPDSFLTRIYGLYTIELR